MLELPQHGGLLMFGLAVPVEVNNILLRVDFVREVAALLQEVHSHFSAA